MILKQKQWKSKAVMKDILHVSNILIFPARGINSMTTDLEDSQPTLSETALCENAKIGQNLCM